MTKSMTGRVAKEIVYDENLSTKAKGIFALITCLAQDDNDELTSLLDVCRQDTQRDVWPYIKELHESGYLQLRLCPMIYPEGE